MGKPGFGPKTVAAVLVAAQLSLLLAGCISVRATAGRPSEGPGGGVAVQVFADDAARRAGQPGPKGVLGELQRKRDGRWETVFRSLNPTWAVTGLPPGKYRVGFPVRLDAEGNIVHLDAGPATLVVSEGRVTEVEAVLTHVSAGLVVAGVVAAVAAAVVLSDFLSDYDLPEPPLPPPELVDVAFQVSLDLALAGAWVNVSDQLPPVVTSHFPADGAIVGARRPKVVFAFSEPLQAGSVESGAVTVLGEGSGVIPGVVSYDTGRWLVTWTPQQDLAPADTYHVTLDGRRLEDLAGNEPAASVSFSFKTAP